MENRKPKKPLNLYLSPSVIEYLDTASREMGLSRSAAVAVMITEYKRLQETRQMVNVSGALLDRLDDLKTAIVQRDDQQIIDRWNKAIQGEDE